MKIDVSDILKDNGASMDLETEEILDVSGLEDTGIELDSPISFKGRVVNINGILELTGRLKTRYGAQCYRCLKDMELGMDVKIEECFVKEQSGRDNDSYLYEGNYIDLDKPLKDNILLNLPMKHVCEENCKGICPICGCDLNTGQCDCREDTTDLRLEALKDFFKE